MPRDPHGHMVEREFLTLPVWDQFGNVMATDVAAAVERCLPEPWAFREVSWYQANRHGRFVAFFDWNGRAFALIPAARVALGYDLDATPIRWLKDGTRTWFTHEELYANLDGRPTVREYAAGVLTQPRQRAFGPCLVEVTPGEARTRGAWDKGRTYGDVWDELAAHGFRWPTFDEWEYFCGAGARTLWWWGDKDPSRNPLVILTSDLRLRDEALTSGDWDQVPEVVRAIAANPFGLEIAFSPYTPEWVTDPFTLRGGDGGALMQGGCSGFVSWLLLATAGTGSPREIDPAQRCEGAFRRVYPIPPEVLD